MGLIRGVASSRKSADVRVALSLAFCALLAFEMFYDLTRDLFRELVAIALYAAVIVHVALGVSCCSDISQRGRGCGEGEGRQAERRVGS